MAVILNSPKVLKSIGTRIIGLLICLQPYTIHQQIRTPFFTHQIGYKFHTSRTEGVTSGEVWDKR